MPVTVEIKKCFVCPDFASRLKMPLAFFRHEHPVADLELVEQRGEGPLGHLLNEEFQLGLERARDDGEGPLQDLLLAPHAEGHILAGLEGEGLGWLDPHAEQGWPVVLAADDRRAHVLIGGVHHR